MQQMYARKLKRLSGIARVSVGIQPRVTSIPPGRI